MKRIKQKTCRLLFCLLAITLFIVPVASAHLLVKEEIDKSLIIVGGDHSYPPFEFLDKDGNPTGFNTELIKAVAKIAGINTAIILGPWAEIRNVLETEKIDAIQGMFYSKERDRIFDFTAPHLIVSQTIFVRKNSESLSSVEELRGKEVIVQSGDIMHDYLLRTKLTDKIIVVETQVEALKLLSSGKHDVALGARLTGLYWLKELSLSNIRASDISISQEKYCFAVKEGNIQLLSRLNEGLMILKTSGEYQRIYDKWLGVMERKSIAKKLIKDLTLYVLLPLLVLLGGILFWTWFLRKQVSLRTVELEREITERKRTEQQLQESEKKFRSISSGALDGIAMIDPDGNISFWNEAAEKMFGYSSEEVLGKNLHFMLTPERYHENYQKAFFAFQKSGTGDAVGKTLELTALRKDGSEFPVELSVSALRLQEQWHAVGIIRDITERKQAEEKIKISLTEKELLLKEIHHRVKNNMQVISSILSLQSSSMKDEEAAAVLLQCQDRIKSMALIHEKLYQSEDFSNISFKGYTESLAETIFRSYSEEAEKVSLKLNIEDIMLDIDTVIPVGLILNELITNSLKHAFQDREKGEIKIAFREIDKSGLELKISDNGAGIPEGLDVRNTDSLGLKLVFLLAEGQLKGEVRINREAGTEFCITFRKGKKAHKKDKKEISVPSR